MHSQLRGLGSRAEGVVRQAPFIQRPPLAAALVYGDCQTLGSFLKGFLLQYLGVCQGNADEDFLQKVQTGPIIMKAPDFVKRNVLYFQTPVSPKLDVWSL